MNQFDRTFVTLNSKGFKKKKKKDSHGQQNINQMAII